MKHALLMLLLVLGPTAFAVCTPWQKTYESAKSDLPEDAIEVRLEYGRKTWTWETTPVRYCYKQPKITSSNPETEKLLEETKTRLANCNVIAMRVGAERDAYANKISELQSEKSGDAVRLAAENAALQTELKSLGRANNNSQRDQLIAAFQKLAGEKCFQKELEESGLKDLKQTSDVQLEFYPSNPSRFRIELLIQGKVLSCPLGE